MKKNILIIVAVILAITGVVYAIDRVRTPLPTQTIAPIITQPTIPSTWQPFEEAGVAFKLPPGYRMDAGAGQRYVVKIDAQNPSPTPDMHISTDGEQINFRRWEGSAWQYWDQVIASIRVTTPMIHPLQINIDK